MMSAKLETLGHLKMKVLRNEGYDVILFTNEISNKVLSRDSDHIVNAVMWPKFGKSSIPMREVYKDFMKIWPRKLFLGVVFVAVQ